MVSTKKAQLTTKTIISAAASAMATAMVIRSVTKDFVPREVRNYMYFKLYKLFHYFSSELTLVIDEYDNLNKNTLFNVVEIYLESKIPPNTDRIKLSIPKKEDKVTLYLDKNQEVVDMFNGVKLNWQFVSKEVKVKYIRDEYGSTPISEYKCFQLRFNKKHKDMVIESYIKHVIEKSKELKQKKKSLRLFTYGMGGRMSGRMSTEVWQSVNLDHPATFETLAMDTEVKTVIMEDLQRFVKRKEFYRRVGKAWKRGYLLYGPPGTGKSSLIAAMANFLKFDIYDLDLTAIKSNTDLRSLLISTGNKSILVVEDIDCSIELQDRRAKAIRTTNPVFDDGHRTEKPQVTLSGLLNFIDGLWSSCGDERIIVFTTNHREKLDPALMRPGRMDVHIHMSYCTPCGFRMLASNYLGDTTEHEALLLEIEELLEITKATPAEVGEQLMKSEEAEVTLRGLIDFLEGKRADSVEKISDEGKEPVEDSRSEVTKDAQLVQVGDKNKPE